MKRQSARDFNGDFTVVAVAALTPMVFDEHEDVVDVDVDLLDELHFEDELVRDRFLLHLRTLARLVIEVQIDAPVVFELARGDRVITSSRRRR